MPEIGKLSHCAVNFDTLVVATEHNYDNMIKLQPRSAQALLEYSEFQHDVRVCGYPCCNYRILSGSKFVVVPRFDVHVSVSISTLICFSVATVTRLLLIVLYY